MADDTPDRNLPAPLVPAPLERAAMERVLARAAELQGATGDAPDGALTEAQLLEVGREVGIDADHLRQALAEERTRVTLVEEAGLAARVAGPAVAMASRVVNGTPAAVLEAVDAWMQGEECLQVKRRHPGRITWEARRDLIGSGKRMLRFGGRGYDLTRASEVGATVTAVDEHRSLVRLDADLSPARRTRLRTGGAIAAVGTGLGAAWAALASLIVVTDVSILIGAAGALAATGLGVGGGYQLARTHRAAVARAQLALEQVLDRLELGDVRRSPTVLDVVSSVARRLR